MRRCLAPDPGHPAKVRDIRAAAFTSLPAKVDHDNTDDGALFHIATPAGIDSLLAETATVTTDLLLRHVRVNAIADYYDIPPLRQLATTRFQHVLETNWSADAFSNVIKEVFNSTNDAALQETVASAAAAHIEELVELPEFAALEVMSDVAIRIIKDMVAASKVKDDLWTERSRALEAELQSTEHRLRSSEHDRLFEKSLRDSVASRADGIIANIDECLETLYATGSCRNVRCEADFTCYIERGGQPDAPRYTLRCGKCRCRHK